MQDTFKAFHNLLQNCVQDVFYIQNKKELLHELTLIFLNLSGIEEKFSESIYETQVHEIMIKILKELIFANAQDFEMIGTIFMFLANLLQDCRYFKDFLKDQEIDKLCFMMVENLKQVEPNQTTIEVYGNIIYFISIFISRLPHYDWTYYSTFLSIILHAMNMVQEDIVSDAIFGVYSLLAIAQPHYLEYFYKVDGTIKRILQLSLANNYEIKERALMVLTDFTYSDNRSQLFHLVDEKILENLKQIVSYQENRTKPKIMNLAYSCFLNLALTFESSQDNWYLQMVYESGIFENTIEYYVEDPLSLQGYDTLKIINEYFSHMNIKFLNNYLDNNLEFITVILKDLNDACDLLVNKSNLIVQMIRILNRIFD